jgi:predicted phage terminase large subunit-like protein
LPGSARTIRITASPENQARLADAQRRLTAARRAAAERRAARAPKFATPGELARAIDPATVQTPALDVIDDAVVWAYSTANARLIVSLPPQEGKSERVTKTGVLWALTRNPQLRAGIASYAQALADGFGRDIRNRITANSGDEGTLDLGLRIAKDYGSAKRWQIDGCRGGVTCAGIGSSLTGRPLDALVIDDPIADRKQADSEYYRERVWDWWQTVGSTRLAPGSPVIVILTRWHEDDLAGRLLKAEDGHRWRVINIPALADHDPAKDQADPLGRDPGQWLVSARGRTDAEWEQIRIQAGSRGFASLYQGRPSPAQGDVWKRQWWRRYHEPLWSQHPTIPQAWLVQDADEVLISVDCAFKDTKSSDFVVMQVWARRGGVEYLLEQVRKQLSFTETVTALQALIARWPQAARKLVEDKANGTAVIDMLKSKVPGLVPVNPTDSKYGRATAVAPFIESGNVLLPAPGAGLFDAGEFIEETAAFPNGAHDDQVDATSQALAEMLLDGTGAQAWIAWIKKKAEDAAAERALQAAGQAAEEAMGEQPPWRQAPGSPDAEQLHECRKPDCRRPVSIGAAYCCAACSTAAEGRYEIHAHDPGCDERAAGRGGPDAPPPEPLTPDQIRKAARDAAVRAARR